VLQLLLLLLCWGLQRMHLTAAAAAAAAAAWAASEHPKQRWETQQQRQL
jgi:hypothetical protein